MFMDSSDNKRVKLVIVGDEKVGKTSLVQRYTKGGFPNTYEATYGYEQGFKPVNIGAEDFDLDIWDTAGQERFRSLSLGYTKGANGVMIVYDVTNQESFDNVKRWISDLEPHLKNIPVFLIGNKTDLETDRVIDLNTGKNFAAEKSMKYFETSAKHASNVEGVFSALAEDSVKNLPPEVPDNDPKLALGTAYRRKRPETKETSNESDLSSNAKQKQTQSRSCSIL